MRRREKVAGGLSRTNARLCRHLRERGGWLASVRGRHGMEEIRGNTAELDKPAGFVLSGVRNENKRRRSAAIAWSMVIGPTIACPGELSLARSLARKSATR